MSSDPPPASSATPSMATPTGTAGALPQQRRVGSHIYPVRPRTNGARRHRTQPGPKVLEASSTSRTFLGSRFPSYGLSRTKVILPGWRGEAPAGDLVSRQTDEHPIAPPSRLSWRQRTELPRPTSTSSATVARAPLRLVHASTPLCSRAPAASLCPKVSSAAVDAADSPGCCWARPAKR
jgi:hypothetical protein